MTSIIKNLFKLAVITAITFTIALNVVGSDRTGAVIHDVQAKISQAIDNSLDDPVALRRELRKLDQEYPARISKVRKDLAGLTTDITLLEREAAISGRVVELANEDLAQLNPAMKEATSRATVEPRAHIVAFVLNDELYTLKNASRRQRQIVNTRDAHAGRASEATQQLAFLRQQESQFREVLQQLEAEQVQFRTQLDQLNRQVDSIQRNARLIDLLDKRRRTLEECSTYDVASLDQLTGKLGQILTEQSVELDLLTTVESQKDYEDTARDQLLEETGPRGVAAPRLQ